MKHLFFSLFVVLLFVSCSSKSTIELADYPSITTVFTEQEVADLQTLLDLFEQEIGIQSDATEEEKVAKYAVFNKQVLTAIEEGNLVNAPLSNKQKNDLLNVLHVGTFRSIWNIGSGVYLNREGEKISTIIIDIHTIGKFADLITLLGKEYPEFTDLAEDLKRSGGLFSKLRSNIIFTKR